MARPPSHLKKTVRGLIAGALLCALPISAHAQDISSRLREDTVTETNKREALQSSAPATEKGLFLVPKVID